MIHDDLSQSYMSRYQRDYLRRQLFFFAGYLRLAMRSEDTTEVVIIHLSHCSNCFPSFWWFPDLILGHFNATLLETL